VFTAQWFDNDCLLQMQLIVSDDSNANT